MKTGKELKELRDWQRTQRAIAVFLDAMARKRERDAFHQSDALRVALERTK